VDSTTKVSRRPGGRSARVRAAVITATLAQLADNGYSGVSPERIATRAGVHKTTVYRRWRTKEALVLDAMLHQAAQTVAVPDTGSLHGDLLELATRSAAIQSSPAGQAVVRAVAGEAAGNPDIAAASRRFWAERLALDRTILHRARDRGEIGRRTQSGPVIEALLGPLYFRLLVTGEPLDDEFIEGIADLVYAACIDSDRRIHPRQGRPRTHRT
jgi:AcrR family transcriptional regulator